MVKDSVDLLELLRKRGTDRDVDSGGWATTWLPPQTNSVNSDRMLPMSGCFETLHHSSREDRFGMLHFGRCNVRHCSVQPRDHRS